MDNNENIYSADFLRNIKYASRGEVPVRLKLTSRHVIPDMRMFGTTMGMPSADLSLFEEEEEGIDMLDRLLEEDEGEHYRRNEDRMRSRHYYLRGKHRLHVRDNL